MTNDLVRGDVNWFDSERRSAKTAGRRKTVATAQDERRRLITLGLMMKFATLAAQSNPRCSYRPKTEDYELAPKAARNHLKPAVDLPHALPKARGLDVTCGTSNAGIIDYFGVCASSDGSRLQAIARLANPHFMPLHRFVKAMAIVSLPLFSRRLSHV